MENEPLVCDKQYLSDKIIDRWYIEFLEPEKWKFFACRSTSCREGVLKSVEVAAHILN